MTDSPDVDVNYITGVGGTFTGITSFTTLQVTGGIVAGLLNMSSSADFAASLLLGKINALKDALKAQ